MDSEEKITVTEVNNMSVIHEEQEKKGNNDSDSNYFSSVAKSDVTPVNAIRVQRQTPPQAFNRTNSLSKSFCKIHFDKPIEYFCRQCTLSVCSKCMFLHHNGHDLTQIDDALSTMKSKIAAFDKHLDQSQSVADDLRRLLETQKAEVESLRLQQVQIIDEKFSELARKLEERKQQLSRELLHKYEHAVFRINDKDRICKEQTDELLRAREFMRQHLASLESESTTKDDAEQL